MKSSIIENIKSLPPLSKTITDINALFASGDGSVGELAQIIDKDPMIVANLLKAANSPLYGFGREIRNASQAVSLFGMEMTRTIATGNAVRKLLNVDMQPYNITSDKFAEISSLQAVLMHRWYSKIDKEKADKLHLAAFLQETGKILIANNVIQEDEAISFASEIENSNNIAQVEKAYVEVTSSEVAAKIFEHWGFDKEFIEMIHYADAPASAPESVREYSTALHIVKTIIPVNKPLAEQMINFGLKKADDAGYNHELLEDAVDDVLDIIEGQ